MPLCCLPRLSAVTTVLGERGLASVPLSLLDWCRTPVEDAACIFVATFGSSSDTNAIAPGCAQAVGALAGGCDGAQKEASAKEAACKEEGRGELS